MGVLAGAAGLSRAVAWALGWREAFGGALAREVEERRFFLWLPVAAMGGVALNLAADREPALWAPAVLTLVSLASPRSARARPVAFGVALALAALFAGFLAMSLRTARVAAPVLDRIRIVSLEGYRRGGRSEAGRGADGDRGPRAPTDAGRQGSAPRPGDDAKNPRLAAGRFCLAEGAAPAALARCAARAATTSPATRSLPASARSARRSGALESCRRRTTPPEASVSAPRSTARATPRGPGRPIIGGDEGAIAAAMVTGKRDFLSNDARDLIREAGIFHIITISGVQMTLVAGIFFRHAPAAGALADAGAQHPIKKWAAGVAMAGSLFYDIATGSRVGTERALVMTLIVLGAVILDRRALTMRNLAFAVFAVIAIEPEAILGVSFQLSFAAVAALVAVMEARLARMETDPDPFAAAAGPARQPRSLRSSTPAQAARRYSSRPPAPPARPPRSWPIISTTSAPMC